MRIRDFAKEIGVSSRVLLAQLNQMGCDVNNQMQNMPKVDKNRLMRALLPAPAPPLKEPEVVQNSERGKKAVSTRNKPLKASTKSSVPMDPASASPRPQKPVPSKHQAAPPSKKPGIATRSTASSRLIDATPVVGGGVPKQRYVLIKRPEVGAPQSVDLPLAPSPPLMEEKHVLTGHVLPSTPVLPTVSSVAMPTPIVNPQVMRASPLLHQAAGATTSVVPSRPPVIPRIGEVRKDLKDKKRVEDKGRTKEKLKSWKKTDWLRPEEAVLEPPAGGDAPVVLSDEPTKAVLPVEKISEIRSWQDFKPVHRRGTDRRGGKSSVSLTPEIAKPRKKSVRLYASMTVRELSEMLGQKVSVVIGKLMEIGLMATVNQPIDVLEASLVAEAFGVKADWSAEKTEEELLQGAEVDQPEQRLPRPAVVTIMGHVDHGKTSLLDAIRQTKVTEGESGGITQHIGAYTVFLSGRGITFLDTPGHEAFAAMRARGAKVTDIVVLVVAANDGVMPQTIEAIHHAHAAGVPIVVAINKVDLPDANVDRAKAALGEHGLIPEVWGGTTIFVEVSAKKKQGLDHFLEMLLLQADVMDLRANPDKAMLGTVIEAKVDRGRGPVATVLVKEGTLKVGDVFVTGTCMGRVRFLVDDTGDKIERAGPAIPVEVVGLDSVPQAGDLFSVVENERTAKAIISSRLQRQHAAALPVQRRATLDVLRQGVASAQPKILCLILKADVQGSVEALRASLNNLVSSAVQLNILHTGVGSITESDVLFAAAARARIIGFHVRLEPKAKNLAEQEKVEVRFYTVIYDAIAEIKTAMEGLLDPTFKELTLGYLEVRQVFMIPKIGAIAGGYVREGTITRDHARVVRDGVVAYESRISSLRRFKNDVKEVTVGYECGVGIENFNDIKIGDVIEVYTQEKVAGVL